MKPKVNKKKVTSINILNCNFGLKFYLKTHLNFITMLKNYIVLILLFSIEPIKSQITLVKDIKPGTGGSFAYSISEVVNDKCYFVADDGKNGDELWITDGTSNGTRLVKNLYPGEESCDPRAFGHNSDKLFFIANDSVHGLELWSTSGDEASTQFLLDSKPGIAGTSISIPFLNSETFVSIDNKIYFVNGYKEIFESDGTPNGTKSILNFNSIDKIISHEDKLYFIGSKEVFKDSIFIYDPKTKTVSSINNNLRNIANLTSTPIGLIFDTGSKLYIYKSQTKSTVEITPGISILSYKYTLTKAFFKDHFYLLAISSSGFKPMILKINGNVNGTEVILNNAKDNFSGYGYFIAEGDYLYYLYNAAGNTPLELWRTDGSEAGFLKLDEYNSASLSSISSSTNIVGYNGKIYYFGAKGSILGLYESDGTVNGTKQLELINDRSASRQITTGPIKLGNTLLFSAEVKDKNVGQELYSYNLPVKTSVSKGIENKNLNIHPNPVDENLFLSNYELINKIDLINQNGKILRSYNNLYPGSIIKINDLSSGIYFIRCFQNERVYTKTIIKN